MRSIMRFRKFLEKNGYETEKFDAIGNVYIQRDSSEENDEYCVRVFDHEFKLLKEKCYDYSTAVEKYEKLYVENEVDFFID